MPALEDINKYKVLCECDYQISEKCRKIYYIQGFHLKSILAANRKIACLYCTRRLFSGRNGTNSRYQLDDNFFENIDTEEKAYILGWIASDGNVRKSGFCIKIHHSDRECLENIRNIICKEIPITNSNRRSKNIISDIVSLVVNSLKMSKDICNLLQILPGKKAYVVRMPKLSNDLTWSFLRGYFEGDGTISHKNKTSPMAAITSFSDRMLEDIKTFSHQNNIPCHICKHHIISWSGFNAIKFLNQLYNNSNIYLTRKYSLYQAWKNWEPCCFGYDGGTNQHYKWRRIDKDCPKLDKYKFENPLYAIKKIMENDNIVEFDTRVKIICDNNKLKLQINPELELLGYSIIDPVTIFNHQYRSSVKIKLIKSINHHNILPLSMLGTISLND